MSIPWRLAESADDGLLRSRQFDTFPTDHISINEEISFNQLLPVIFSPRLLGGRIGDNLIGCSDFADTILKRREPHSKSMFGFIADILPIGDHIFKFTEDLTRIVCRILA